MFTEEQTVLQHLQFHAGLKLFDQSENTKKARIEAVLRQMRLHEKRGHTLQRCSGGERKRVSI